MSTILDVEDQWVIRHSSTELESLIAIAASVAGAHRIEDVLEVAATRAREAMGAATLSISRWEVERGCLRTLINAGEDELWPQDEVYPLDDFPAAVALLRAGRPHIAFIDDADTDPAEQRLLRRLGMDSSAAVPIVYEGATWGELYATSGPDRPRLSHADVRYMQAICGQIGLALGRAELFSRMSALAFEDPLTGLANRRAVGDRLDELAARGEPAALLLGDLDGLKAINDADGHAAGDAVLRGAARALRDAAGGDTLVTVARLGGDEFCVLMPGASAADAKALTRLVTTPPMAGATFSWGLALTSGRDWKPAALLRAADMAQYEAKRHGGNCLRTAADSITAPSQRRPAARTRDRARLAARIVDAALGWLDGPGRDASAARRVQAVAEIAAGALDASSWSVSEMSRDAGTVSTITYADRRLGAGSVVDADETFLLADYPETLVVVRDGGGFHLDAEDPEADAAERMLLARSGRTQLLAAGASGQLVELYGDGATPPMGWATASLRLLVREAVSLAEPSARSTARVAGGDAAGHPAAERC